MAISVVIPVYNSEQMLEELVARLQPVLQELSNGKFEVILVNDGSRDGSGRLITQLAEAHQWIHGIQLMRNYGQHNALLCGIRAAKFEVIVTMDDDLQHPPEEIPRLVQALDQGFDVAYGKSPDGRHGIWRNMASRCIRLALAGALGSGAMARQVSAFRAFRAEIRNAFAHYRSPFVSIDVLLSWGTTSVTAVDVQQMPRQQGKSNYSFSKLLVHAADLLTGFSTVPLQLASLIGFLLTLFGCGVLVYVIGRYLLLGGSVPGFPFLASVIAIFSGSQLFALGIIGEYIGRIHRRTMERPAYIVRSGTGEAGHV